MVNIKVNKNVNGSENNVHKKLQNNLSPLLVSLLLSFFLLKNTDHNQAESLMNTGVAVIYYTHHTVMETLYMRVIQKYTGKQSDT